MFVEKLEGRTKIRILDGCVAGFKPRAVGDVVEVPAMEALELIALERAEPFVPEPTLTILE